LFPKRKIRVFYRSGTYRVRSKTLRARDAERWCVSQSDVVYILISARSLTTSLCPRRRRYSVWGT